MRLRTALAVLLFALVVPLATACGNDGGSSSKSGVTDEEYLKVLCTGLSNFSDAVISKTSAADIGQVIKDYIAEMKKVDPPADLAKFHADFVKYLEDAVSDPTSLLTRKPPLPPDDVRKRLASKEPGVSECKNPTFFDTQQ
jgi:hypothetical protein